MKIVNSRIGLLLLITALCGICLSANSVVAQKDIFNNNTRGGTGNAPSQGGATDSSGSKWEYTQVPREVIPNQGNIIYSWCRMTSEQQIICQKPEDTYQRGGLVYQQNGNGTSFYNNYPAKSPLKGGVSRTEENQNDGSGSTPVFVPDPNYGNNRRRPIKGGTNKTVPRQNSPKPYFPTMTPGQRASRRNPPLRGSANNNLPSSRNSPPPGKRAEPSSKYRLTFTYKNHDISGPSAEVFPDKRNDKAFYVADVTDDSNIDTAYYQMIYSPMNKNNVWARIYQVRSRINGQIIPFEQTVKIVRQ